MDIYSELQKNASSLKDSNDFNSIDAYLGDQKKISSMDDLLNFVRIGNETLVHKAEKDLWRICESEGQIIIERLFDPNSNQPIRV